jgi:hypothetical protein
MLSMDDTIDICKKYINENDLEEFKEFCISLLNFNYDWPYLFQKVYIHSCLKKRQDMAEWLHNTMYSKMDPIQQIALRQIFPYGKYLLNK